MQSHLKPPHRVSINMKEDFENMRVDIVHNYPALTVFTYNVENLNTLFDQLVYGALDFVEGRDSCQGFNLAMDILIRNGLDAQVANQFVLENIHRVLATMQSRFAVPIANSGMIYVPVRMRFNHLELERSL